MSGFRLPGLHMYWCVAALSLIAALPSAVAVAADAMLPEVGQAVAFRARPHFDIYRDDELKPGEVLSFAGIRRGMAVAEVLPEAGYWTRLLSVIVGKDKKLYMIVPRGKGGTARDGSGGVPFRDRNQNEEYNRIDTARALAYQPAYPNLKFYWVQIDDILAAPEQLDAVVLAQGYHRLKSTDLSFLDGPKVARGVYRSLKNGGVYLVIGASARSGTGFSAADLGRADPAAVKAEVLGAGFELAGESNLLSRPNDPRSGAANDNSDMYVLLFKKPLNAENTDKRPNYQEGFKGYFENTWRTNPGLIRKDGEEGPQGARERRIMFHADGTYEERGQEGSGDNPILQGELFFNADGVGCMDHMFPFSHAGFTNCNMTSPPGMKVGDRWCMGTLVGELVAPGYFPYPDKPAKEGETLGNTPQEIARKFGDLYGFAQGTCKNQRGANQYLRAYYNYRSTAEASQAQLDAQFASGYGKALPSAPGANE